MRQQETGKTYIQKLQTFAYVCLGFPLLFFIYFYLESSVDRLEPKIGHEYSLFIFIPAFLMSMILIYLGFRNYHSMKLSAIEKVDFKEKLRLYLKASNTRFLYYGACTSIITLGFFITNYEPFAALFGVMIVFFSIHNPNARKIVNELKLKGEEKSIILTGLEIP
jgi:hypothetical protein